LGGGNTVVDESRRKKEMLQEKKAYKNEKKGGKVFLRPSKGRGFWGGGRIIMWRAAQVKRGQSQLEEQRWSKKKNKGPEDSPRDIAMINLKRKKKGNC